ncbi:MAG: tetratricopeptide repeat protein [Proteobacteria bacterium]|nr:tetratricopeptide repeat protein [Pseudomonadota bacterium]NIS72074.1 tetratricopeptide repeat protein [Pseudomonadota bacterium]
MTTARYRRKLTAILSSDVKDYSRLMGEDEEATVRTLTAYRELMATLIQKHRGRVVDSPGDNVLAEFPSVVDAVRCAVEVQEDLRARNAELPEQRRMEFRIGVNLGDVIVEGERIYGDGVNVAARVEGLADAGGISISGSAYEQIENKLTLGYEYVGEHTVKNIKKPVRVYRVRMKTDGTIPEVKKELVLPEKPSIAVLPFVNMSGDPDQEYFSDGITEEIITALSKVPRLFVIARNSSFTYKGKSVKVQEVGRELGVRYVLEGSVRKAGDRVRITAQLIDAITGHHLRAERYDRYLKDVFTLQDEITMRILTDLQCQLTEGEQAYVLGKGTENYDAYVKILQGREHIYRMDREGIALARQSFEEAVALDRKFAVAYTYLAWSYLLELLLGFRDLSGESMARAVELAQKALTLDDSLADAHALLGSIYLVQRQWDKAVAEGECSVALNPNSADNIGLLGITLFSVGRLEEAVSMLEKAIRLNPMPPNWLVENLATAYRMAGRYEEAIAELDKVLYRNSNYCEAWLNLAAIYVSLGQKEEARAATEEVLRLDPNFSLEHFAETLALKNQATKELYINNLRKAGLK